MARVVWSPDALDDLDTIRAYIGRNSRIYAAEFIERILVATDRLEMFPLSGRVVPEKDRDDYRELIVQNYRVLYVVEGDDVNITAVVHGTRRLPDISGV